MWVKIDRDPKLMALLDQLSKNSHLRTSKIILFTESKETAEYLTENINKSLLGSALCFTGGSDEVRQAKRSFKNFDAKAPDIKDDYRILISTEVLSEGVNLHRSNVVINYDIPWNPTRMMQRVGRINRVDTKFDTIYTFNFFPTRQSNDEIQAERSGRSKNQCLSYPFGR